MPSLSMLILFINLLRIKDRLANHHQAARLEAPVETAAMAGVAGVLYSIVFRQLNFIMGFIPGIKAFTAAVLGGIGSIPGAALGGLFLGVIEAIGPPLFLEGLGVAGSHQLKDVIAFTMLVLVLIFRPQGIIGERLAEKKA